MRLKFDEREFETGDIIKHFKYETLSDEGKEKKKYLYKFVGLGYDTTNDKDIVIYEALYMPYTTYTREINDFLSEVDHKEYPNIKQKYKFIVVEKFKEETNYK